MDAFNYALANQCDYTNKKAVRYILKHIEIFKILAESGNGTAHCVLIDINKAMSTLKTRQKYCVEECLLRGKEQHIVAEELGITQTTVHEHIKKGIRNIMIDLEGIETIEALEVAEKLRGKEDVE